MKKISFLLIFILSFGVGVTQAGKQLIFGVVGIERDQRNFRVADKILQEIAKKMEVIIQLKPLPGKRATLMLRNGEIHAELARLVSYIDEVPTSIRIEEPYAAVPIHAYTQDENIKIDDWSSLKSYRIVTVRGFVFLSKLFKNNNKNHLVDSVEAAFGFLEAKRADVYIGDIFTATSIINSPAFIDKKIIQIDPPIAILNSFTFFSSKYPSYAEQYRQALVEIKKEGIWQDILLETQ